MNFIFRCDASNTIGTGHVRRCLALANELSKQGNDIQFMSDKTLAGHLCTEIEGNGFPVLATDITNIPKNTDCIIIDHYGIDAVWERQARQSAKKIMVIDDIANRPHDCDILLDQNYYPNMHERYKSLVPMHTIQLLGPQYALLRPEFRDKAYKRQRDGSVKTLFINYGGKDPHQYTLKTLQQLENTALTIHVVMGARDEDVLSLCQKYPNWHYHENVSSMAEIMMKCDIAIGAGGSSLWERASLGLPSFILSLADNQIELSKAAHQKRLAIYLGHEEKGLANIPCTLERTTNGTENLSNMAEECYNIFTNNDYKTITELLC